MAIEHLLEIVKDKKGMAKYLGAAPPESCLS
jgi:hypothetical protein